MAPAEPLSCSQWGDRMVFVVVTTGSLPSHWMTVEELAHLDGSGSWILDLVLEWVSNGLGTGWQLDQSKNWEGKVANQGQLWPRCSCHGYSSTHERVVFVHRSRVLIVSVHCDVPRSCNDFHQNDLIAVQTLPSVGHRPSDFRTR